MASVWLFPDIRVVIRGAGDLASGAAFRLVRAGFPVIMTELATPLFVRRAVSYGNALYENGAFVVEGIRAVHIPTPEDAEPILALGEIPLLIDPDGAQFKTLNPTVVVDARMRKYNINTTQQDAELVIALGPGFTAGLDCHAVIETQRGHTLGRVIWQGTALNDSGTPGIVAGYTAERVLRAPTEGHVLPAAGIEIGSRLQQHQLIATVSGQPITAPFPGVLRGLIHPSVRVWEGLKIGDLDPRGEVENCFTISDKSLGIGGGVLEAILSAPWLREKLIKSAAGVLNYAPV